MPLMLEQFIEDLMERTTPPRTGGHRPVQIRRDGDSALHGANQLGSAAPQLLDQVGLGQAAPAADLARVPAVLVEWFGGAGRRLGKRRLYKTGRRLLRAAEVSE